LRYSDIRTEASRYLRQTFWPANTGGFDRAFIFLMSRNTSIF